LRPDKKVLGEMEKYISEKDDISSWLFADQDFLNEYFKDTTYQLPYIYNTLKTMLFQHENLWDMTFIRNIHFILEKPWNDPSFNCPKQEPYKNINQLWWNMFETDNIDL
jgi:lipopolysaccharide biosynthesis glycosyltransferase